MLRYRSYFLPAHSPVLPGTSPGIHIPAGTLPEPFRKFHSDSHHFATVSSVFLPIRKGKMILCSWIIIFDHGCSVCPYRLGLFLRCFVSFVFCRFRCHFRVGQSAVTDRILCLIDTVGSFQIFNHLIATSSASHFA